jgi:hypothetical protein
MAVRTITVDSSRELEMAIHNYASQGFLLLNKTDTSATMRKPKEFNVLLGILGFVFCVVGLIIYAIIYSGQSDQFVEIRVVEQQAPKHQLSEDRRWWWDGQAWQSTEQSVPPGAERSEDGSNWWDGTSWRSVPASERRWSANMPEPPTST